MFSVSAALTGPPGLGGGRCTGRTLADAVEAFYRQEIQTVALQSRQYQEGLVLLSSLL